jgi:L-aminopeptidase/D-esterase-like protein
MALNLLTDVAGLAVGHAEDLDARTGVTVVLPDRPAVCAVDVRGGGPGTRETDALGPDTLVERVDAVVLAGGSVYGLAAADGVAAWLGAQGRGFALRPGSGAPPSPIVPAAILYDLANGGAKAWGETPPYRALGRAAAAAAARAFALGSAGAGLGAAAGAFRGGIGSASDLAPHGETPDGEAPDVAALAAVNAFGSVVAGDLRFLAGGLERDGEFGGLGPPRAPLAPEPWPGSKLDPDLRGQTTLAVVATDADLTVAEARRLAVMAQAGLTRAIRPAHTPFDGDVVFALATGARPLPDPRPLQLLRLGARAADALARAIARGVFEAAPGPPGAPPTWREAAARAGLHLPPEAAISPPPAQGGARP